MFWKQNQINTGDLVRWKFETPVDVEYGWVYIVLGSIDEKILSLLTPTGQISNIHASQLVLVNRKAR